MNRCSRCKEKNYPLYKYKKSGVAGVYCESCLNQITGISLGGGFWGSVKRWLKQVWEIIKPVRAKVKSRNQISYTHLKQMRSKLPSYEQRNPHHLR